MNLRTILIAAVAIFILYYILSTPTEAAGTVSTILLAIGDALENVGIFLRELFQRLF